jgi:sugar/nucleoside kinase (ribokinase family)
MAGDMSGGPQRMLVIGDVMIDVVGSVQGISADEACAAGHSIADLRTRPSGTGVIAALAGRETGIPEVGLWASVGVEDGSRPDAGAIAVRSLLRSAGIRDLLRQEYSRPTGTVVCLLFDGDQRLLLANPGANSVVCAAGLPAEVRDFARGSDLVYVSGYALQVPNRAAQVLQLLDLAVLNRATVALDLVPHRIDEVFPDLRRVLDRADVLIGELPTLTRVCGGSCDEGSDRDVELLAGQIVASRRSVLIRQSNHRELFATRAGSLIWSDTGYAATPLGRQAGFLDQRAVRTIVRWLTDDR